MSEILQSVDRLTRDLAAASITLSDTEARFLVDTYYTMQDDRIRANNQVRALNEAKEPHDVLRWLAAQSDTLESQIRRALTKYAEADPRGAWPMSIVGIGPIITAGLMSHIDITKAPTVGHIWRFAGLDPTTKWEKGQKRPWNARLKVVCWKAGESFVKVSGREDAFYGQIYAQRKALETQRNDAGEFAEQAAAVLALRKIGKDTDAYKAYSIGKLPPAHVHARAKRYAVKLFLSHLQDRWYRLHFGKAPPLPYPIAIGGHADFIDVPTS
jgi:Transposase IS116/IS110/IS902 family